MMHLIQPMKNLLIATILPSLANRNIKFISSEDFSDRYALRPKRFKRHIKIAIVITM
jgi:hypothetical protein